MAYSNKLYTVTEDELNSLAGAIQSVALTSEPLIFPDDFIRVIETLPVRIDKVEPLVDGISPLSYYENLSLTQIRSEAFKACANLISVNCPECQIIYSDAFSDCTSLANVSFPKCTIISDYAFDNCDSLQTTFFPKCTTIGKWAFDDCNILQSVYFPECTTIENNAFTNCASLQTVSFPKCTTIGNGVFHFCIHLQTVYLLGSSVATLSNAWVFYGTPIEASTYIGRFGSIYVPTSLVNTYKAATNWATYADRIAGI